MPNVVFKSEGSVPLGSSWNLTCSGSASLEFRRQCFFPRGTPSNYVWASPMAGNSPRIESCHLVDFVERPAALGEFIHRAFDMFEPPVRIENRTQLVFLLSEAAELEHGISCCYLFAGFTMKNTIDEGVTEEQLEAITRWKKVVTEVAIQEMLHLTLVNNLLTAIGAAPHIRRPNLPTSPNMYPKSFELDLRLFNEETLKNFIFLERPEGFGDQAPVDDSPRSLAGKSRDIFSDRPEYRTVGHLYRGIEDGFKYLAEKYGEDNLFVGSSGAQMAEYPSLPDIVTVTDLASAVRAIQQIVEQGEGARGENEDGHYARFLAIQDEYQTLKRKDQGFEPARPVVVNPYTHIPSDVHESAKVHLLDDPLSVAICNLFDGVYELLIQMLGRLFARMQESEAELQLLAEMTTRLMGRVIGQLGDVITTLPAGLSHPGLRAGPSFHVPRNIHTPLDKRAAWLFWRERLAELSAYCALLETFDDAPVALARIGQILDRYAARIAGQAPPG